MMPRVTLGSGFWLSCNPAIIPPHPPPYPFRALLELITDPLPDLLSAAVSHWLRLTLRFCYSDRGMIHIVTVSQGK